MINKLESKRFNNSLTIELTKEGEVSRNYIVLVDLLCDDYAIVLVYRSKREAYQLISLYKMEKDRLNEDFSLNRVAYGKGGNWEYILITRFLNNQVFKCHFIPAYTLNRAGIVYQILKDSINE